MSYKKSYIYETSIELKTTFLKVYLSLRHIDITNQCVSVLAYMWEYGATKDTIQKIVKAKVCPHRQSFYNCRVFLKNKGLIQKNRLNSWSVSSIFTDLTIEDKIDILVRCSWNKPKEIE